ncbi:MAG TPA: PSD1 and planctomycete cytochrome C domain-containing protein [Isosphaeraceae bacterium]|nr:PSD1 and planctomycete cytochrome C domain-containing protein [Isosphaeraceae bacterium]
MKRCRCLRWLFQLTIAICCANLPSALAQEKAKVPADHPRRMQEGLELFRKHVRPVLVASCLKCHGGKTTKGDLDLSDRAPLLESGVIEGGKESRLLALITHEDEPYMPYKAAKLPQESIDRIARWIELGAPYDKPLVEGPAAGPMTITDEQRAFWSFQPLSAAPPPAVRNEPSVKTAIDRFILAEQEKRGLAPNAPADRRVLVRRLFFDLIGLPPAPEEIDLFLADTAPGAYERLVDRLLDSPHYGERWARHWMDVARFAESHGYEQDYNRPHAYHYRDFLIKALNEDMPFDQFLRWQVAGDELAPEKPMALAATGFLGAGAFPTQLTEAEFESARYNELDDMTATLGTAFLGLSVGCARCHDHKYDPIPSEDYYRLAATFTTTIRSEIDLALEPGAKPTKMQVSSEGFPHTKHNADERGFPHFYPQTYILKRGDVNQRQGEATPGFLRVLMRGGKNVQDWQAEPPPGWTRTSFHRAALAHWLTDTDHGAGSLAARVIVNRLWQHHFGTGIVATPNDFGLQGERPTHPQLLDWLASDMVRNGWRLKRLHRLIVTSAVYQEDSRFDEPRAAIDLSNQYLWRRAPRRVEAEPIRDAMLSASGLLDPRMFGPGSLDLSMRRRSLYFFIKRSELIPTMMLFDWPEHLVSIGQRGTTTTAPQALMFMNSALGRRCAESFAYRLEREPGTAVRRGYKIAFGREPSGAEAQLAAEFLCRQQTAYLEGDHSSAEHLALVDFCQALMSSSEFIYIQ